MRLLISLAVACMPNVKPCFRAMNKRQRLLLWIWCLLVAVLLLFPPYLRTGPRSRWTQRPWPRPDLGPARLRAFRDC
jgi:hypothetical protein